jgi:hypothetical protein
MDENELSLSICQVHYFITIEIKRQPSPYFTEVEITFFDVRNSDTFLNFIKGVQSIVLDL